MTVMTVVKTMSDNVHTGTCTDSEIHFNIHFLIFGIFNFQNFQIYLLRNYYFLIFSDDVFLILLSSTMSEHIFIFFGIYIIFQLR